MRSIGIGIEDGEDLILSLVINAVKLNHRMLLVIFQILVALQNVEHLSVGTDIVAVDNNIGARRFQINLCIYKRHCMLTVFAFKVCTVVFCIIGCLNDRIVQICVINADPSDNIRVNLPQSRKGLIIVRWITWRSKQRCAVIHLTKRLIRAAVLRRFPVIIAQIADRA